MTRPDDKRRVRADDGWQPGEVVERGFRPTTAQEAPGEADAPPPPPPQDEPDE